MIVNKITSKILGINRINASKKEGTHKEIKDLKEIENIKIENIERYDIEKTIEKIKENSKNIHRIKPENIKPLLNGEIDRLSNFRKDVLTEEIKKTNQESVLDSSKIKKLKGILGKNFKG